MSHWVKNHCLILSHRIRHVLCLSYFIVFYGIWFFVYNTVFYHILFFLTLWHNYGCILLHSSFKSRVTKLYKIIDTIPQIILLINQSILFLSKTWTINNANYCILQLFVVQLLLLLVSADDAYSNLMSVYPALANLSVPLQLLNSSHFSAFGKLLFMAQIGCPNKTIWQTEPGYISNIEKNISMCGMYSFVCTNKELETKSVQIL